MADIDSQIGGAYEKQITAKQLYKILANFDKLYYRLTDLEKKEFLRDFIESVEIYPENEVELEMSEMDLTAAESKATYEEIKDYVLEHTGLKVSSLYITQVKEKYGIVERVNYNLPKSENS